MKPEIKEKWLAALRSGKYEQGNHQLRDGNAFCCLGVLADIYSKETGAEWKPDSTGGFRIEEDNGILPYCIYRWAGLNCGNPWIIDGNNTNSLSSLNDNGMSFKEIANIIESKI